MREDQSRGKCRFQGVETRLAVIRPKPSDVFLVEVGHWSDDVGIAMDIVAVKIGEAKEGLYVHNLPGHQPILDYFNFSKNILSASSGFVEMAGRIFK